MRFTEIINPEDQLALWRLISDKVWTTFGQAAPQLSAATAKHTVAPAALKPAPKVLSRVPGKPMHKGKTTPTKKGKPTKAPMASPPKPLPKPKPLQPTQTQTKQAQSQQHQQLAHHIKQALTKKPPGPTQPTQHKASVSDAVLPIKNGYNERDKDELVFHRRQDPFRPIRDQKPL